MGKPTPGPWVIARHPMPDVDVFGVGEVMDDKEMQYALSHTMCYQNAEANAPLISAAPDLLEALEIAESAFWGSCETKGQDAAIAAIRAAIAKAKGESA